MKSAVIGAFAAICAAQPAQANEPLSAIDWLSQSVRIPMTSVIAPPQLDEPPVADSATSPSVTTTPLDGPSPDSIGLLAPSVSELPRTLWSGSDEETLVMLLRAVDINTLPAMRDLLQRLLLAEADPPRGASNAGGLFQARVDKLLDLGAIEPAQGLLEQAQIENADLFRRWFDVALLSGTENEACAVMQRRIDVAPTYAARIFCLARGGDWPAAALSLNTHIALGDLSDREEALLSRFLDPELFEDEPPLGPPERISPLMFRMYEAIGERLSTSTLPRAFAHADLGSTVGWKSQLEAAERLTRHGAIAPNVLFALYTSRTPSASGGVWDRVSAFQDFDQAIRADDRGQIIETLPTAWAAAREAQIEVAFAAEYGAALATMELPRPTAQIIFKVTLLSTDFQSVDEAPTDDLRHFVDLANGTPDLAASSDPTFQAIAQAFHDATPPERLMSLVNEGKLGEALLRSYGLFAAGQGGDAHSLTDALAFLRAVGLDVDARKAALQLLILDRPL